MCPKTVDIIRHAEKPEGPHDPNLSLQGIERARALAKNCEKLFGKLDCLSASETSAASARSVETIDPLAQAIHLEIDSGVSNKDYSVLAATLLADPEDYGNSHITVNHPVKFTPSCGPQYNSEFREPTAKRARNEQNSAYRAGTVRRLTRDETCENWLDKQ